jgi:hypothetical protein
MKLLALFLILCFGSLACADDFKTINGKEYKNVTVKRVEPDDLVLSSKSGISKVYFNELPKEVQERFHYNAAKAKHTPPKKLPVRRLFTTNAARDYSLRTDETFDSDFLTCDRQHVERDWSNRRTGQRYPGTQPSFSRRPLCRFSLHAVRRC